MNTPKNLKFAKTHEWIKPGEEGAATTGISSHAQESLGDITFVELPAVGSLVKKGEQFGVIESVKAASDLYAPASGEVVSVNDALESAPEKINQSPYEEGWLIEIKLSNPSELDDLLSQEDYENNM